MSLNLDQIVNKQSPQTKKSSGLNLSDLLNRDISFGSGKIKLKEKEAFYLELYSLLSAGIDVKASLEIILSENAGKAFNQALQQVYHHLISGLSLSESIEKTNAFTPYEYYSIQIGEETGKLIKIIEDLAIYFGNRQKQQRQLVSALSYPILILTISVGAVLFMILYMVPMFRDVFTRFGGELPKITQTVIDFSSTLNDNLLLIFICFLTLIALYQIVKKKEWLHNTIHRIILKIPFIGPIYLHIFLSKFCTSMSLLISSKVQIIKSIELVGHMTNFYSLSSNIPNIKKKLLLGHTLHESLKSTGIFDDKFIAMIKIGEEVNQLDQFFDKLGKQYTSEIDHKTALMNTFLEPMLIIFLGLVVGFILVTMYLPMFQISTNLGL